ncbi:MAG: hypothetical protein MHPSP_002525, partial [Paramarteilia canceri]
MSSILKAKCTENIIKNVHDKLKEKYNIKNLPLKSHTPSSENQGIIENNKENQNIMENIKENQDIINKNKENHEPSPETRLFKNKYMKKAKRVRNIST